MDDHNSDMNEATAAVEIDREGHNQDIDGDIGTDSDVSLYGVCRMLLTHFIRYRLLLLVCGLQI